MFGKSVADRLEVLIPILAATFVLQVINPNKQGGRGEDADFRTF